MRDRLRYRGPGIVDVGEADRLTIGGSEPVHDPGTEPATWEDVSKFPEPEPDPPPPAPEIPPDPGPTPPDEPVPT